MTHVLVSARVTDSHEVELRIRPARPPWDLLVQSCPAMRGDLVAADWATDATLDDVRETATWTSPGSASETAMHYRVIPVPAGE